MNIVLSIIVRLCLWLALIVDIHADFKIMQGLFSNIQFGLNLLHRAKAPLQWQLIMLLKN